jgi:hypothetical protein
MGLRGAGAKKPIKAARAGWSGQSAWQRKRSRVDRVVSFLEQLPITKGILVGTKMKLLPGQRQFVQAIYSRVATDGRRKIRIAIKSEPRGNGNESHHRGGPRILNSPRCARVTTTQRRTPSSAARTTCAWAATFSGVRMIPIIIGIAGE